MKRNAIMIVICLFTFTLFGCTSAEEREKAALVDRYSKAMLYLKNEDYDALYGYAQSLNAGYSTVDDDAIQLNLTTKEKSELYDQHKKMIQILESEVYEAFERYSAVLYYKQMEESKKKTIEVPIAQEPETIESTRNKVFLNFSWLSNENK